MPNCELGLFIQPHCQFKLYRGNVSYDVPNTRRLCVWFCELGEWVGRFHHHFVLSSALSPAQGPGMPFVQLVESM